MAHAGFWLGRPGYYTIVPDSDSTHSFSYHRTFHDILKLSTQPSSYPLLSSVHGVSFSPFQGSSSPSPLSLTFSMADRGLGRLKPPAGGGLKPPNHVCSKCEEAALREGADQVDGRSADTAVSDSVEHISNLSRFTFTDVFS